MSPYDQAFLPGNRVLLYLEGPSALSRELAGTVLGMNPVGLVLAADPGSLDEGALRLSHIHDDGELPPLFLSWNCIRAAFLLGAPKERQEVSIPMPKCMENLDVTTTGAYKVQQQMRTTPQPEMTFIGTPVGTDWTRQYRKPAGETSFAAADWVPEDQPVPRVPVVKPPLGTPEVTLSDDQPGNDFHAALVAELNALRKAGKLYG